ncbi:hypothetical protein Tco_0002970 [Tanacetum coccineum]
MMLILIVVMSFSGFDKDEIVRILVEKLITVAAMVDVSSVFDCKKQRPGAATADFHGNNGRRHHNPQSINQRPSAPTTYSRGKDVDKHRIRQAIPLDYMHLEAATNPKVVSKMRSSKHPITVITRHWPPPMEQDPDSPPNICDIGTIDGQGSL